jgi:hypothetical protein
MEVKLDSERMRGIRRIPKAAVDLSASPHADVLAGGSDRMPVASATGAQGSCLGASAEVGNFYAEGCG